MDWSFMDRDGGIFGGILRFFGPPVLMYIVAIIIFSYLVSTGKKSLGIWIGAILALVATGWLVVNIVG